MYYLLLLPLLILKPIATAPAHLFLKLQPDLEFHYKLGFKTLNFDQHLTMKFKYIETETSAPVYPYSSVGLQEWLRNIKDTH